MGICNVVAYFFISTQISLITGFALWCVSNTYFFRVAIREKKAGDILMWGVYDVMNVVGILKCLDVI